MSSEILLSPSRITLDDTWVHSIYETILKILQGGEMVAEHSLLTWN